MLRLRKLSFLTLILLLSGLISACTTTQTPSGQAGGGHFLWEASKGSERLTLIGTMHMGISAEDLPQELWQRLAEAETVIIEADVNEVDQELADRYLLLPADQDFATLLGHAHWERFKERILKGFPKTGEDELRRMTPMAAGCRLLLADAKTASQDPVQDEDQQALSVDQIIFNRARALGKDTQVFESVAEQFAMLTQAFDLSQVKSMIDGGEEQRRDYLLLQSHYRSGNVEAIDLLLKDFSSQLRATLLDERNRNWIKKIPQLKASQHTLIAVGAAHFGGEQGFLKLLEAEGYSIRRINDP